MTRIIPALLFLAVACQSTLLANSRTITNQDGASLEVELNEITEKNGVEMIAFTRVSDQRPFEIPLKTLSFEDQREIRKWWEKELKEKSVLKASIDLEIDFKRNRRKDNMTTSSYYDYNNYQYTPEVRITNDDLYQSYLGNTVRIVCLAEHTYYKGSLQVVSACERKVDLPRNGTATVEGDSYSFTNNKSEYSNYEYGWEQAGYIIIIKNSKGDITHTSTNNDKFLRNMDTVLKCRTDEYYTSDLSQKRSSYSR